MDLKNSTLKYVVALGSKELGIEDWTNILVTPNDKSNNGTSVPLDPANSDYAEIMKQVDAGELTIEPADEE